MCEPIHYNMYIHPIGSVSLTKSLCKKSVSSMITGNSITIRHIYVMRKKKLLPLSSRIIKIMHAHCKNKTKDTKKQKRLKVAHLVYQI